MKLKKFISVLICVSMLFCLPFTASAETADGGDYGIMPCALYLGEPTSTLTISGTTGVCRSTATGVSGVTKIVMTQTIEKHWAFGIFIRVDGASWTNTVNSSSGTVVNRMYNMESGTYRMVTDFTFYTASETGYRTVYSTECTVS